MKVYPLGFFVKRILLIRLCAATAAIAVVVGAVVYVTQTTKLADRVIELGHIGIATLVDKVRVTVEQDHTDPLTALREVLGRGEPPKVYRSGRFVSYQVYDRNAAVLAASALSEPGGSGGIQAFLDAHPFSFPESGHEAAVGVRLDGNRMVYLAAPVADRSGRVAAYVRGVFSVSPEIEAAMRKDVRRSVALAIGIVIAVAALFYPVILHLVRRLADYATHLLEANLETLSVLGNAIAKRDSDTDAHNYRVSLYSVRVGETIGLPDSTLRELIKGSFLHDVGKIGIPDDILLKPGKLDKNEFTVMQTHVKNGMDIIHDSSWLRDSGAVVGNHHEKYGGGGYPGNLSGDQIPIAARIFAIADVFDALTSSRPYKQSLSFAQSMEIIEAGRGNHFDPKLLDAFAAVANNLYDRYAGRDSGSLRQELVATVKKYFSAGMERLSYGKNGT